MTNGTTEARSTGEIEKIGLLMSFRKGLFAPTLKGEGSFAELQAQAFKGSDFGGGSEEEPMPGKIKPPVYQFALSSAPKFVHRIKILP